MIVLIDGKEIKCNNDVQIIHDIITVTEDVEVAAELHVTATHEGVILDVVDHEECLKTAAITLEDLEELCH